MKKGISFYFGYDLPAEERARLIEEAGFDSVITSADPRFNFQNGSILKQMKLFKKYNLTPSSLHMRYKTNELPYFWKEGKKGERLKRNLIKDVKLASKYNFTCVVVHLAGEYSSIGEKRLKDVLKVCAKKNVPLAIENINYPELLKKVLANINHSYLKFCYDSGHHNVYDKDFEYLKEYGDKLVALHLHDNDGVTDQHSLNMFGTIDWEKLGKKLAFCDVKCLDYELLLRKKSEISCQECLKKVKEQADKLEKIIEEAKNEF